MRQRAGQRAGETPGVPTDIGYTVSWPSVPELRVGETLAKPKFSLPAIYGQTSVEIIYQQSASNNIGESVTLIHPTRERSVPLLPQPNGPPRATRGYQPTTAIILMVSQKTAFLD